jgi:hypothetical protein
MSSFVGVVNPFACFSDKEFKKAVYTLKSRKGWVNIPSGSPPRGSGRSTTILYLLNKMKTESNALYLDFHHASSEASLIAYLLSQLHIKYTAGSSAMGMVPVSTTVTYQASTKYITKQLFFEYFALFLEKLQKDVIIVFDNIEPTGYNLPVTPMVKESSSMLKRPSFNRSPSISATSSGLNSNHVMNFIQELIAFIDNSNTYLRRFTFVMVGGAPGMLASAEAEGVCKTMDLPTYNNDQLKIMALEVSDIFFPLSYIYMKRIFKYGRGLKRASALSGSRLNLAIQFIQSFSAHFVSNLSII